MTVRLGVVGVGWWATFNHIPTVQADARATVSALADPDAGRLKFVGDRFGVAARYADFRQMLAQEQLDGVIVASPHVAHAEAAVAALEAGKHVLVEKPMVTTVADARAVVAAAKKASRQVMVPCGWNFKDYTDIGARMITEGRIGEVRHVVCQMASALTDLFAGEPMSDTATHLIRPAASTWADPQRSGGYGWGQMSHSLAWIYRVTGLAPQSVYCMSGKSPTGVDYYDAAAVRMTNGATMALSGASTVPKHCGFQMDIRIFGSEGILLFDIERERLELHRHDGRDEVVPLAPGSGAYQGELPVARFIALCAGEAVVNPADAENGARVVETLDALYRSIASGEAAAVETAS